MPTKIKPRRSALANTPPTTANIEQYELAINTADKKIYTRDGSDNIVVLGAGNLSGLTDVAISSPANGQSLTYNSTTGKWQNSTAASSGDVVGPASSTDNALVRFDGTTGKLIQNSTAILTDAGELDVANVTTDYLQIDTAATTTSAVGRITWDAGEGTATLGLAGGNVNLQLGQENVVRVYNGTGATITNGSVVAVSGAQGQRPSVVLADADSEPLSAATLGIATENIANGTEGFVATFGVVNGLDTSAFTAGAPVYLSQTAGGLTATRPSAPAHTVFIGWVLHVNASSGRIFININNGWELDELHNVLISSPTSGQLLIHDQSAGVWKNASLTAGTGVSVTNGAGSITLTNTAPNVTTDISITHNASSVVVNSSDGADGTINAATTSLAGVMTAADKTKLDSLNNYTLPAATSLALGGIELFSDTVQTTAANTVTSTASRTYGIQVNSAGQAVVNVPWTDTNSGGTVTSVGMTVPTGLTVSGTPITSSGTLALSLQTGYSIPTTASQANWDTAFADRNKWDGGATGLTASTGRTSLGATTVGSNLFTLTNPSAVTFLRLNADNTVSTLDAATFRTAIGAQVSGSYLTANQTITLSGDVTGSGSTAITATLANTGVTAGSYTLASITVDAKGRITAASNGSAGSSLIGITSSVSPFTVALGQGAGNASITGVGNVAIGYLAGDVITSGAKNILVGQNAGGSLATSSNAVGIGVDALASFNGTGSDNAPVVAIGRGAMQSSTGNNYSCVAIGDRALQSQTSGYSNTAVGGSAGFSLGTGIQNTFIGRDSGQTVSSGSNNTFVGWYAGQTITTGGNNTIIGANAQASSGTVSNEITLGNASITKLRVPGVGLYAGTASTASAATITPDITVAQYNVTALAVAATFAAPAAGVDGQKLTLRIKDNGTARALTWTTTSGGYRAIGTFLPSTTVAGKVMYIGLVYNSQDTFWDVIAVTTQA